MKKILSAACVVMCLGVFAAEQSSDIDLPEPNLNKQATFRKALEKRRTTRAFSNRALSVLDISNLLWAAYGDNRPNGKRTVPAAMGLYNVTLYVALQDGLYWHNRNDNVLKKIASEDVRMYSDGRKMGARAPMVIIMVAEKDKSGRRGDQYTAVEAGAIMQNIYLYCSAYDLGTVVCGSFNNEKLSDALKLPANKYIIMTQVVGCLP